MSSILFIILLYSWFIKKLWYIY